MTVPDLVDDTTPTTIVNFDAVTVATDALSSTSSKQYGQPKRSGGQRAKFRTRESGRFDNNYQFSYMLKDGGTTAWVQYKTFKTMMLTYNASNGYLKRLQFIDPDGGTEILYGIITTISWDFTVQGQVTGSFDFLADTVSVFK